ncbi:uncharacterized protein LOC105637708 isoform X2 [Jatropha curcas]|uniref:uncharacterized protein LOC105637708 isoform X2 n=1 Tax=Jatropha curcas TaxID=180498 RepID=UPI0009D67A86|nr:uncharacterized protein LOC105637708 isoform X2 [Jatropha curcas]
MAQAARLNLRMQKELKLLLTDPPLGASFPFLSAGSELASLSAIDAQIKGPEGTVYAKGIFNVKIQIPERYPFQPPSVTFATPIYHPNIDNGGRICLDILNLPPKGAWQPSLNISTVLTSIGLLLSEPNPDDGLMCEASKEYKYNRQAFDQKARAMTEKYARGGAGGQDCLTRCIQTNSDISTVEFKHSDEELKHEANGYISSHNKPGGISRKLSLGPSSSTHKKSTDGKTNGMPDSQQLDLENVEGNRDRKEARGILDEYGLTYEKLCGNERKLTLESSVQKDGNNDLKQFHPFCNTQSLKMASPESSLLQGGGSHELQLHQHHDGKSKYDRKIMKSNRLSIVSQKIPGGSLDACQTSDGNNEKMLVTPVISSPQTHSISSGALTMFPSVSHDALLSFQDSADKLENDSTGKKCEEEYSVSISKKLSLGLKGSSEKQEKDNKENVMLINKLSFSTPETLRKVGIGRKLSLGPPTQLQSGQLLSCPEVIPKDEPQMQKSDGESKQCGEESQLSESIIVLDSEDSEEESNGPVRSKLSLVRKRIGKRKTQA